MDKFTKETQEWFNNIPEERLLAIAEEIRKPLLKSGADSINVEYDEDPDIDCNELRALITEKYIEEYVAIDWSEKSVRFFKRSVVDEMNSFAEKIKEKE